MINEKETFKEDYKYFLTRVKKAKTILNELKKYTTLNPNKKIKVLAVGGAYGFIEYNLAKWTKWNIITSDIEKNLITKYPILRKYLDVRVLDTTKLPFENDTFDLVIFNHVIEHIPDYKKALKELYRVLKQDGYFYLATPNIYRKLTHPKIVFAKKKGISDNIRIAHHMGFSKQELESLLSIFGSIKNITKDHMTNNLKIFGKIAIILPKTIFHRYSQTNVFVCRK